MKRLMTGLAMAGAGVLTTAALVGADGHARVVVPFELEAGEVAEGVVVDWDGDVFTGLSAQGRMLMVPAGGGEVVELAALEGLAEGDFGFTGHALSSDGRLYSAVVSSNPELNGLVGIDPDTGEWTHVAGTEGMAMANGIGTDGWGSLYVSDTILGAIWLVYPSWAPDVDSHIEQWVMDPLLAGTGDLPLPFPVGANGVALRGNTLYVANTEQSTIVAIPMLDDAADREPYVHLELPGISPDGIAFDFAGNLYVADPPAHTLWKVTPDGEISAVADGDDGLSGPSSVSLLEDGEGSLVAYVSNQAIGEDPPHGPSIVAITLQ